MSNVSAKKLNRLEEIRDKIENEATSISFSIKLLVEAYKTYRELKHSLFKKRGKIMILKEDELGNLSLHKFEEDEQK